MIESIVLFGTMMVAMLFGVPLGFSVAIATIIAFIIFTDTPLTLIAQSCVTGIDSFSFIAIPLFIMAGVLMSKGGIARRIVDTFYVLVGDKNGGLGLVAVVAAGFFGAISGSATATVSAIGGLMMGEMKEKGYPPEYNAMCIAAAGSTSLLIPPSVCLVIYGVATNTSIGDLLIAGIMPGLLTVLTLCFSAWYYAKKNNFYKIEHQPISEFFKKFWEAKWAIFCPVIIIGGIYTGIFTPTESAAVATVYAIIIGFFVYKNLTLKILYESLKEAMILSGMVAFMLGTATAFAKFLSIAGVPAKLVALITGLTDNPIVILLICNLILLILGCVVDNIPLILIMSPLLLPIVTAAGMSPITFGCVMVLNTTIGILTPPYGANLYLAASMAGVKMESTLKYFPMYFIMLLLALAATTYVPFFTLGLL